MSSSHRSAPVSHSAGVPSEVAAGAAFSPAPELTCLTVVDPAHRAGDSAGMAVSRFYPGSLRANPAGG